VKLVAVVDSAIPLYAAGAEHNLRSICRDLLLSISDGRWEAYASAEMLQEFMFHRLRITGDRQRVASETRSLAGLVTVLPFDQVVLEQTVQLVANTPGIRGRDAVHAATALVNGIDCIVSPDRAFNGVPGLVRLDPNQAVQRVIAE
jgi:predicted nucleic acid-binding protein